MNDCVFCKIIRGEIPSTKVYEDEETFAFFSISPNNQGHTLVIPKKHFRNLMDMDEPTVSSLALVTQKITRGVYNGIKADGVNIIMNNEAPAGQAVFHAHIHVIPRFKNDGLRHWDKQAPYGNGEKEKIAEEIKKEIK
ncbi:MAG: HIT family protein [Candidatus Paceibacterota bacterium]|jgi:histidine triad (HIT) family protein